MSNCKGIFIALGTSTINVGSKNVLLERMLGSKLKFLGSSVFVLLVRSTSNAFIREEFECLYVFMVLKIGAMTVAK